MLRKLNALLCGRKLGVLMVVTIGLMLVLSGCGSDSKTSSDKATEKEPIKIGAVIDISGPGSSLGVPERDSILMWEKEINDKGGINGRLVKVIIKDNESDETKSVLAIKDLIENEKVVAVAGASQSGTSIAMIDTATKAQIPLVSAAASIKITTPIDQRKWVFKTAPNDSVVAGKVIDYMKSKNMTKVAFLSLNNAFGDSGLAEFSKVAAASGITIVAKEKFGATDVDFTAQLTNIKKAAPQAMLIWAIPPSAALITKQAKDQLGMNIPVIQSHGIANKKFIELAGKSADGVVFPAGKLLVAESLPESDAQKQVLVNYVKGYEKADRPRSTFGGHGYDAVLLIGKAIEKAGADPAKIRDELEKMTMPGISGMFKMTAADHNGIEKSSLVMIEIKNGKWELLK
ncbi:MAG: ABC transporter substrate-binding protein [Acidobacteriota bacterium]